MSCHVNVIFLVIVSGRNRRFSSSDGRWLRQCTRSTLTEGRPGWVQLIIVYSPSTQYTKTAAQSTNTQYWLTGQPSLYTEQW